MQYIEDLEAAVASGAYTEDAVISMNDEISRLEIDIELYQRDIEKFTKWMDQYPVATEVWFYLRDKGFSEEVASGIIGNMMIETSGGTLNLKPKIYSESGTYYGLCQWSKKYYPKVHGKDVNGQLEFLMNTIEKEFKAYGHIYKSKFTYQDVLDLDSPEAAAHAFAKVYERCGSGSYGARKRCARIAYEYFTSEVQ